MFPLLQQESQQLQQIIRRGIDWLEKYDQTDKRPATIDTLGKLRRKAKRLEQATMLRPAWAIFGESQVGKSYLVSNLARLEGQQGLLIDTVGMTPAQVKQILNEDGPVDFIRHINPIGGGTESTGIVTRFTTTYQSGEQGYLLRLLNQVDLVKLMATGYIANITNSPYASLLQSEQLDNRVKQLQALAGPSTKRHSGFDEDDTLDIRDYLVQAFGDKGLIIKLHEYDYWGKIASLIPLIEPSKRWEAFAPLWHEDTYTTQVFNTLSEGLMALNFVREIRCGLDAIAPRSQTIVDVARLYELNDDLENKGNVSVATNDGRRISLNRSVLTALTSELVLPLPKELEQSESHQFLQYTDILDFPGARTMGGIEEEAHRKPGRPAQDTMAPFLRGKIYYLFRNYSDTFGISSLTFCLHDTQTNVRNPNHFNMVYDWIKANVGASPTERDTRERQLTESVPAELRRGIDRVNPFSLVFTKVNNEIKDALNNTRSDHERIWLKRLGTHFNDEFKKVTTDYCIEEWTGKGAGFKNSFFVRDPRYGEPAYVVETNLEQYSDRYQSVFEDLEASFVGSSIVKQHFIEPMVAWREAMSPGNNGVSYLLRHLLPASHPRIKQEQLAEALQLVRKEIGKALCEHYEGGSVEEKLERSRKRRDQVTDPMLRLIADKKFGQLLARFTLAEQYGKLLWDREMARQLINHPEQFLKDNNQANGHETTTPVDSATRQQETIDTLKKNLMPWNRPISAASPPPAPAPERPTLAGKYAESLLGQWVIRLKDFRNDGSFRMDFGLAVEETDILVEEMVRSMEREQLKKQLTNLVSPYLQHSQNLEVVLSIGRATINTFVNTMGWGEVPETDKFKNNAIYQLPTGEVAPVFSQVVQTVPGKHQLQTDVEDPASSLYSQWFSGFYQSFEYNVLREANLTDPERARINGLLETIIRELNYQC
ncbi:virulence factor SrfC family protein [Spirosoma linguale]|uniref:Uncharacterized protein putative virulence factor-like protein n=1 Tax=Spirosoma linguale (strain ATCC 33905 / DSM 74 / LMG 10896 / Claus 1) TaxID=504472 RepID=D2QUF5_SPILD|nr:Uncharacterized protein putative virulence factor-like protein [Spirosoma linguale DSM 74]